MKSGCKADTENLYLTEKREEIKELFEQYLTRGGMPEYLFFDNDEILHQVYEDIVIKDIAVRHSVDNALLLKQWYQYLISNPEENFQIIRCQNCPIWLPEAPL
jgi:predicted AAA+ superfamily ATPase